MAEQTSNYSQVGQSIRTSAYSSSICSFINPAESCTKQDHSGITDVERLSGEVASDVTTSGGTSSTVTSAETSQSVKVEADGSVFICADESYLRDRNKTLPVVEGKRDPEPPGNQLRLSNDLLYSLD